MCCFVGCVEGGWLRRRVGLSKGLGTPLMRLLNWCSVLLQNLPPSFVKVGCSSMCFLGQMCQSLVPLKGLLNLGPAYLLAFPVRCDWAWQITCCAVSCSV